MPCLGQGHQIDARTRLDVRQSISASGQASPLQVGEMVSGTSEYLRDFIGIVTLFGDNVGRMLEEDQRREAATRISCPAQNLHLVSVDIELQEVDEFEIKVQNHVVEGSDHRASRRLANPCMFGMSVARSIERP
jgi:hypothetical protein